jgi:peptidyl-prolyl cis-trans isomerase B (cyclophilin B)
MLKVILTTLAALVCAVPVLANTQGDAMNQNKNTIVNIETNKGNIKVELFDAQAPKTVANFKEYMKDGFYNNTIFHRVIDGFMIQGGGFTADFQQKSTKAPITNEASKDLLNKRGTLAMARTSDVNSATAQFFINVKDNDFLDHRNTTSAGYGYAVFGKVVDGMDVVDKIAKVKTGNKGPHSDVPTDSVVILKVTEVK